MMRDRWISKGEVIVSNFTARRVCATLFVRKEHCESVKKLIVRCLQKASEKNEMLCNEHEAVPMRTSDG